MRKTIPSICAVLILATSAPASAGWFTALCRDINRGYHRNHCWPQPFAYQDYQSTKAPFGMMVHHGWRQQNIIGSHAYRPGTTALNEAGQLHVRWIVTSIPENRRTIYVERGGTADETAARMEAVRQMAQQFATNGEQFDVQETRLTTRGSSGEMADKVNVGFSENAPTPVLPGPSAAFGGGGG